MAVSRYRMGGCSLARRMSQPDSPERATTKRDARVPTAPAPANLPRTGASSLPSSPAVGAICSAAAASALEVRPPTSAPALPAGTALGETVLAEAVRAEEVLAETELPDA